MTKDPAKTLETSGADHSLAVAPSTRLTIKDLSLTLPNGRRLFDRVSLSVQADEVVVILGPSGAGKSTLGDVLFDLLSERSPGCTISCDTLSAREDQMALVLQRGSLFDHLDVRENIRFAARRRRKIWLSDKAVEKLLEEVGIGGEVHQVSSLSGGEERRVNVARALATNPELIFFDEPAAGLDVSNVHRIGALIRKVCSKHHAGAVVVTHNALLAALCGDRLLYLDRRDGSLANLLDDWQGPIDREDDAELEHARCRIEKALLEQIDDPPRFESKQGRLSAIVSAKARRVGEAVLAPGKMVKDLLTVFAKLPGSLLNIRDFFRLGWMSLHLTGYSGLLFFILVASIFSATFLSIAFAAADLVSPRTILENLRGNFILALTPALCGFLFAARSGSALTAWLGGLALRRQTDALVSLGVSVDQYLRVPAFFGTFFAFIITACVFGAAMYGSAIVTATGFGITDAAEMLRQTSPSFERQFIQKVLLYGALVGVIGTHMGLLVKRSSHDVAKGITRCIILSTLAIVLSELVFAVDLHA